MTKDDFLATLDRKLQVINEKERKDIIDEYRTHIEMKMQEGKSEEEAIADFGNIDELVDDILDAYKINTDRVNNNFDRKLNTFLDQIFEGFKKFIGSFTSLEIDDVVKLIFEILIIMVLLLIMKIPFSILASLGGSLLHSIIGFGIGSLLSGIWHVIINIIYIVMFVVVFVNLCSKRIHRYRDNSNRDSSVFDDFKESFDFDQAKETVTGFTNGNTHQEHSHSAYQTTDKSPYSSDQQDDEIYESNDSQERKKETYYYSGNQNRTRDKADYGVGGVVDILLKIFGCLLLIPFVCMMIGLCCAFGVMVSLSFEGLTLVGSYLLLFGALIINGGFITLIYRTMWKRGA